jgi:hypothetical protein
MINNIKTKFSQQFSFKDIRLPNINNILLFLLFSLLFYYLVVYIISAIQNILYPYQIDYGEGYILYFADSLAHGKNIYPDSSTYPFIPALYSPLYSLILSVFVKYFGLSFFAGRIISFVSALLIGFIIYKIIRLFADYKIALIGALLFFSAPYVNTWTSWIRVDTLGLLFSLTGVYFVLKYEKSRLIYLSILFFLLAVYTKQSFLITPFVSIIYLFSKNKTLAMKIAIIFLVSVMVPFIILNSITQGQFYSHMIVYQGLLPQFDLIVKAYSEFLKLHIIIFILGTIISIYLLITKKYLLFALYFFISAITDISVGRPGASANYFLELIAVLSILCAFAFNRFQTQIKQGTLWGLIILTALVSQLLINAHNPFSSFEKDVQINKDVTNLISSTPGDILSEDAGLVVLNNKTLYIEWFMNTQLSQKGYWDQSNFVSDLKNKRFSLIILRSDANYQYITNKAVEDNRIQEIQKNYSNNKRYTTQMLEAILTNYHLSNNIGYYFVYEPNN